MQLSENTAIFFHQLKPNPVLIQNFWNDLQSGSSSFFEESWIKTGFSLSSFFEQSCHFYACSLYEKYDLVMIKVNE